MQVKNNLGDCTNPTI